MDFFVMGQLFLADRKLTLILEGELDEMIDSLTTYFQAEKLKEF